MVITLVPSQLHPAYDHLLPRTCGKKEHATGISRELHQQNIEDRVKQEISMMPVGIVGNLSPEQLADLIAYLESLH